MWVPMTEWTILMLHGVARLPATAAGLETASRLNRRKDFPGASGAQIASLPRNSHIPASRIPGQLGRTGLVYGRAIIKPTTPSPRKIPSRASACGEPRGYA